VSLCDGQRIGRRDSSNNVFYYFADRLGTSRALAEVPAGQSTASLCYDADFYPFGRQRTPIIDSCDQNYKFTGKERDIESGLDNFGARYASSNTGRFISVDPISVSDTSASILSDPQSWNGYAYVRNNPLNLTDPTGLLWCTADYRTCISDAGYNYLASHPDPNGWHLLFTHHIDDALLRSLNLTPAEFQQLAQRLAQYGQDAAQLLDGFNEWLGFGERSDCAKGGDCINALWMAGASIITFAVLTGSAHAPPNQQPRRVTLRCTESWFSGRPSTSGLPITWIDALLNTEFQNLYHS
jgi:RHS repeat-associated protein